MHGCECACGTCLTPSGVSGDSLLLPPTRLARFRFISHSPCLTKMRRLINDLCALGGVRGALRWGAGRSSALRRRPSLVYRS